MNIRDKGPWGRWLALRAACGADIDDEADFHPQFNDFVAGEAAAAAESRVLPTSLSVFALVVLAALAALAATYGVCVGREWREAESLRPAAVAK